MTFVFSLVFFFFFSSRRRHTRFDCDWSSDVCSSDLRIEGRAPLAVTWTSSKWSHRAPDDAVLLRAYVGGAGRETVLERDDNGLVSLVRAELRDMMGVTEAAVLAKVYRWPRAMPQYLV